MNARTTTTDAPTTPRPRRRRWGGNPWWSLAFLLPALLAFGLFAWWPMGGTIVLGFQTTNLISPPEWVGWSNFERVLGDPILGRAALNTLLFTLLAVSVSVPFGITLAVVMSELRRFGALYRTLVYLPTVVPPVVGVLLWRFFYNPDTGIFNEVLGVFGLGPFLWLQDSSTALPSLVAQFIWADIGGTVIIYLAALTSVDRQLYEAAEIDGASIRHRIWHVTLPQMRGVILVVLLLQLLGTFQIFTEPYIMTGGGPANSTITVLLLIFRYAFEYGQYGMAAALSTMFAVVLAGVSAVYLWATNKWSTR